MPTPPRHRPAQSPTGVVIPLPRDTGPLRLYAGALRHLAGRAAHAVADAARRIGRWAAEPAPPRAEATAWNRAVAARHPSSLPPLAVVPGGYGQGRADLQFTHSRPAGHGASEGDPDL